MGTRETQARAGPVSSAGGTTRATSVAAPGLRHPRALCTIWADAVPPPGSSSLFGLARPLYLPLHSCKCCLWHSCSGACSQPRPQLLPRVLELGAGRALAHQPSGRVCAPRRLRQVTVPELSYHPAGDQASSPPPALLRLCCLWCLSHSSGLSRKTDTKVFIFSLLGWHPDFVLYQPGIHGGTPARPCRLERDCRMSLAPM